MSEATHEKKCSSWNLSFAHFILRTWVGIRLFMAGLDKFRAGDGENVSFSLENYAVKSDRIAKLMADNSLIPAALCGPYAHGIGYALLIVGAWTLIGLFTELSLFAGGLLFLSLGFGLSALPDDMELTANIGVCILITAAALATSKNRKLSLDGLFFRKG